MNFVKYPLLACTIFFLTACGGGGGGVGTPATPTSTAQPGTVTLKLSTSGSTSALLAGIGITVTLPNGVSPRLNGDGSVAAAAATVSGVAAPGTTLAPVYTPPNGETKGTLRLVMASGLTAGFETGEFATVVLLVTAGSNPGLSDFALSGFAPIDINGNIATGLTATVANVTVE